MYTIKVFGTAKSVLFIEVSSFQDVLNKEVSLSIASHAQQLSPVDVKVY